MDSIELKNLAERYEENRNFISNEESTKQSLIIPFINALGYDTSNPREVRFEYRADFTSGDGKRFPDRMDFAVFDTNGDRPLFVIEAKPLGTDISQRSPQLARYMSQLPDLRFGIMSDGCHYLFYGDLVQRNVMDSTPFFSLSLDDPKLDYEGASEFLNKFSHGQFSADHLIDEAEDSNFRQLIIKKLISALRNPSSDESFVGWISEGIYPGRRTQNIMERFSRLTSEAIKPAILRVLGDDFLNDLRKQITGASDENLPTKEVANDEPESNENDADIKHSSKKRGIITTEEEMEFFEKVKNVFLQSDVSQNDFHCKDTIHYFNVSYKFPTKWFVRYFGDSQRTAITTLVPTDEAKQLAEGFEIETAPSSFGVSRIYINNIEQVHELSQLIIRSLEICRE